MHQTTYFPGFHHPVNPFSYLNYIRIDLNHGAKL